MEEGKSDQVNLEQQQPRRAAANNHHQQQPPRKCPRCDSSNTKFCYYNNYSLAQPRHFCKACRRYWTHGGTLRNVPVGGGCRKGKRSRPAVSSNLSRSAIARSSGSLSPAIPSRNSMGMIPAEYSIRGSPSMGNNSFHIGGRFLSSLAAAQSALPLDRGNEGTTVDLGGGNSSPYGENNNTALLQGINLTSMMSQAPPHQFQAQNELLTTSQQSLNDNSPRALTSYFTESFINREAAASSSTGFWSSSGNQPVPSFIPNPWSDHNHSGFPPSQ